MQKITEILKNEIAEILAKLGYQGITPEIELPKDLGHGDYSTNVAMKLARVAKKSPQVLAKEIVELLDLEKCHLTNVEIAGAGFINLFVDSTYLLGVFNEVLCSKDAFGDSNIGNNQKINLEFVSANPTGFLHLGHCRGAAYGDSLARIMSKAGYAVTKEHYVNDAGNQITNMGLSVYERYRELYGLQPNMGEDYYYGKEIIRIAQLLRAEVGDSYLNCDVDDILPRVKLFGTEQLLRQLKVDLERFNVTFDVWFSEKNLYENNIVQSTLDKLISMGYTYQSEGAIYLKTTEFGDDKDRVIVKSDGSYTYLLPDIGYHSVKLSRGFTHLIDVLGADHHGYVPRLKAAITMIGGNSNLLDVEILQMVRVLENGEEVKMSKRSGKAITMSDLIDEVGTDTLRYFFVCKSLNTQMDLDLDLMRKKTNENPLFYAQYAHARICSLFRNFAKVGEYKPVKRFELIDPEKIKRIAFVLQKYPELILEISQSRLVHKMTAYIDELSATLHSFYNDEKVITDNKEETLEKLTILDALRIVLKNALELVGITPVEQM